MTESALSTAKLTQSQFEKPFEAMETLLMEISPMFKVQFEKLLYAELSDVQSLINREEDEFFINHSWY
jgi:hypothetical protein